MNKDLVRAKHIDDFISMLYRLGYEGHFNFGDYGSGLKLAEAFHIINQSQRPELMIAPAFPLRFAYLCSAPTCDQPHNIIRFTVDYGRDRGINIIEMDMRRMSCYEGYDMAYLSRTISNNKIPSKGQVHQMLMKAIQKHKKRLKWRRF